MLKLFQASMSSLLTDILLSQDKESTEESKRPLLGNSEDEEGSKFAKKGLVFADGLLKNGSIIAHYLKLHPGASCCGHNILFGH